MRLIVITANLMQRLAGLPATPDITLLDLRKPKPHPRSHTNTTFRKLTYIRWCCIDLSNAPGLPDKWFWDDSTSPVSVYQALINSPRDICFFRVSNKTWTSALFSKEHGGR